MAMNIKQAKQQIEDTLRAYLTKDELGNYLIPTIRQRPVLLMGPPGIGKTQIMEQIAADTGVGLVAYTITHHTRQSAIGLPYIEHRTYDGQEVPITEYTMSEILASVYDLMEQTGVREGILFLDEINCVSETLAPVMLQFLQCKTFGNRSMPEGWLIVAAGNPPEYNRSAREFDVVTLDRVKRIDVEEDLGVWKEYARAKGVHGAVISYLDIKKENFYRLENTQDGMRFATARGWEDLSELILAYENLDLRVDRTVIEQYIQMPEIAKDFAGYLDLYYKYQRTYHVEEVLDGSWEKVALTQLRSAPFDEKLSVMGLLVSRLSEMAGQTRRQEALADAVFADLKTFRGRLEVAQEGGDSDSTRQPEPLPLLDGIAEERRRQWKRAAAAGQLSKERKEQIQREIQVLEEIMDGLREKEKAGKALCREEAMDVARAAMGAVSDRRQALADRTGECFDNTFRFLEEALGQGQEMVMFVTEITAGADTSWFVENFGCEAYYRHNKELLFDDVRARIRRELE